MRAGILSDKIFRFAGLLLIFFVVYKSCVLDFTHDEAYSFHNVKKFWYAEFLCTGNSHWLNSAAMKLAVWMGLENPWALRWFSICSFALFVFAGTRWVIKQEKNSEKLLAFSLLFLSPYLLDFFSLARGYAGALMLELIALFLLEKALRENRRRYFVCSLICTGLSAIANFGFVYFFFAFSLIYFTKYYFSGGLSFLKQKKFWFDFLFTVATGLVIARAFLFILRCSGNDVTGAGDDSLIKSFYIVTEGLVYDKFFISNSVLHTTSVSLLLALIVSSVYGLLFFKKHQNIFYQLVSSVFILMILCMTINYYAFQVVFPFSRSSLLFFPFVAFLLYYFSSAIIKSAFIKNIIFVSMSLLLIINFLFSICSTSVSEYKQQSQSEQCFNRLKDKKAKRVGISPDLYGVFINYYQLKEQGKYPFAGESFYPHANASAKAYDYLLLSWPWFEKGFSFGKRKAEVAWINAETKLVIVKLSPDLSPGT